METDSNSLIDWNAPFRAEDFKVHSPPLGDDDLDLLSKAANARFRELLDKAPTVYKNWRNFAPRTEPAIYWTEIENDLTLDGYGTHQAKLIDVRRIE